MNGLRFRQLILVASRNFFRFRLHSALLIIATATGSGGVIASAGYAVAAREKIVQQFSSRDKCDHRDADRESVGRQPGKDRKHRQNAQ